MLKNLDLPRADVDKFWLCMWHLYGSDILPYQNYHSFSDRHQQVQVDLQLLNVFDHMQHE